MLVLPLDIAEAIIRELLARKDRATVKSLSLVRSSFTAVCQRYLLSHITITCSKAEGSKRYQRSTDATQKLLRSSPHLISSIRSLSILDSGSNWTQLDPALLDILHLLTDLTCFSWKASSSLSKPTRWNELPQPLQDAIRVLIRRPLLNTLFLHFADLTNLLNTTVTISPSLRYMSLRSTGYSNITLEMTLPSIIPSNDSGEISLSQLMLFVTACKLEWIEDEKMFFGWMSAVRPNLCLERLRKLAVLRCSLQSTLSELSWGPLLYHESVQPGLEELWLDMISTNGPPVDSLHLDQLPSLRRLGVSATLSGFFDSNWELISGLSRFFENADDNEVSHLILSFSFSGTFLMLDPARVPWWNLDAAVAALPALQWIGIQFVDCRREPTGIIPPYPGGMLPLLTEKGVLHWSTSRLEFPAT
ncbi:hypothetical protein DFJ43DRAFT_288247 [Lentinula guzmanii]|uniref:Uncharacterized protein n=1 Tax=Lentinula guzmanii TaxID=2804957 RepID=A0AA38N093_9AGAR|nr:hypothetical protein DFJ43DRAFT_288247 [Lentinula guzmanii]